MKATVVIANYNSSSHIQECIDSLNSQTYENLEITFLVDEKLTNYIEVHNWMVGIGFPQSRTQYGNLRTEGDQISPSQGKEAGQEGISGMFSDATLTITSATNNPII